MTLLIVRSLTRGRSVSLSDETSGLRFARQIDGRTFFSRVL
jgi:hypothetical protein